MKYIGLADCNNFFVSCERVFRPDLWDKPVVVLSSNDGAIVARSQEVKELGVPMGVPYFKVRDEFEKAGVTIFSSNFDLYSDISKRVMDTLREELGVIYQYSVDESFFKMELKSVAEAKVELTRLKTLVQKNIGIPLSFGLAPTMTLAKYASELEKRGSGVSVLTLEGWENQKNSVSMSEIWGVGGATTKKMREHNLITVADFLSADNSRVEKIFGVNGTRLRSELSGIPAKMPEGDEVKQKSIMSTRSFSKTTTSLAVLEEALAYHTARASEELRSSHTKAGKISILLGTNRYSEWVLQGGTAESMLPYPTNDTIVLLREVERLAHTIYTKDVPYKKVGVVLSQITADDHMQLDLFSSQKEDDNKLMSVIDTVNKSLGRDSITIGRARYKESWSHNHNFRSQRYTTSWNDIPRVNLK
ncbi:Y-family DNA polymerase [Candidatus Nomurabacteria bacterium]|nr:Y-family DNA polymerase [Candidatus Nomurabacteria bacterium]MCB9819288.1 Y-family DNA polymerase [Candidatus Nomurabacteria bacterium]